MKILRVGLGIGFMFAALALVPATASADTILFFHECESPDPLACAEFGPGEGIQVAITDVSGNLQITATWVGTGDGFVGSLGLDTNLLVPTTATFVSLAAGSQFGVQSVGTSGCGLQNDIIVCFFNNEQQGNTFTQGETGTFTIDSNATSVNIIGGEVHVQSLGPNANSVKLEECNVPIPEPATLSLLGLGLSIGAAKARRRNKNKA